MLAHSFFYFAYTTKNKACFGSGFRRVLFFLRCTRNKIREKKIYKRIQSSLWLVFSAIINFFLKLSILYTFPNYSHCIHKHRIPSAVYPWWRMFLQYTQRFLGRISKSTLWILVFCNMSSYGTKVSIWCACRLCCCSNISWTDSLTLVCMNMKEHLFFVHM